jgi:hypothetical protein
MFVQMQWRGIYLEKTLEKQKLPGICWYDDQCIVCILYNGVILHLVQWGNPAHRICPAVV